MTNTNLAVGSIWRLHYGSHQLARLTVIGSDTPWVYASVEALPGFEPFRAVFAEQEQAIDMEDWARADACYGRIRTALSMTLPDGSLVSEFMVHIHADGTAGWRWHDEPFPTEAGR